jgi:hypothetical protein
LPVADGRVDFRKSFVANELGDVWDSRRQPAAGVV